MPETDPQELARRIQSNRAFAIAVANDPVETLRGEGVQSSELIQQLHQLAVAVAGADARFSAGQLETTAQTSDRFKEGLERTLEQIDEGFRATMLMYQVAFYLGVVLILAAAASAILGGDPLISGIFGALGVLDFLGFFLTNPPRNLQRSRTDLAQLQAAYFSWFVDVYNWNSFLRHAAQTDQLTFEVVEQVSGRVLESTRQTLELVETYCDLVETKGK